MKRQARIVSAESSTRTLVELDNISQCRRCQRGEGCGAVMIGPQPASLQLWINDSGLSSRVAGQRVLVEIDDGDSGWLWPVFAAYGLPLSGMLAATALSTALASQAELFVLFSAIAGLAGGIIAWRRLAPGILAGAERGLCLQSARIVAVDQTSEREP